MVEQAKQERQRKLVQAEGEAKAAEMLGEAIKQNSGYLDLRKIKAAQAIAKHVVLFLFRSLTEIIKFILIQIRL